MNKYINTFATSGDYETYKASSALSTPNVAYIEDSKEVKWLNSKKDLYNIYGTLTGDSATATININGRNYSVSPSGADNGFGLNYAQPVTELNFQSQSSIKTLDKLDIGTSGVTSMASMFNDCSALTTLDVSNWNTNAVTNMSNMFSYCYALTALDVSNWNTSAVTDMRNMFRSCHALTTLDLSNWNTSAVANMSYMFFDCEHLTTLDVSNWNNSAVTDMSNMFRSCHALTTLDLSNWNTSAVTNMSYMFTNCNRLTTLTMNNTNTTTFGMIKAQLVTDGRAFKVTIIRDGVNWKYQNGAWVEA